MQTITVDCNTSAFGDVERPAPPLWIRGDQDQVVSDQSILISTRSDNSAQFPIGQVHPDEVARLMLEHIGAGRSSC